jgi:hypothetical protein
MMGNARRRRQIDLPRTDDAIQRRIHLIRGERVMLDADLAALYAVETKQLNQAVRRNRARFPADFMFQLTADEASNLRSQFVTSSSDRYGGRRYLPYAFTEHGVAILSSVLKSSRAVAVNILIVRAFVQLRRAEGQYAELRERVAELARKVHGHDELLDEILSTLEALAQPATSSSRPIGFRPLQRTSARLEAATADGPAVLTTSSGRTYSRGRTALTKRTRQVRQQRGGHAR